MRDEDVAAVMAAELEGRVTRVEVAGAWYLRVQPAFNFSGGAFCRSAAEAAAALRDDYETWIALVRQRTARSW